MLAMVGPDRVDLVMSGIAPNMMGVSDVDHDRSMQLVELAVDLPVGRAAPRRLPRQGAPGSRFPATARWLRERFDSVKLRKPKASRARSDEVYVLARGYRLV